MKISEAMRTGKVMLEAQGLGQITGLYAERDKGCCAAGMALLGSGTPFDRLTTASFDEADEFPEIADNIPLALTPLEYREYSKPTSDPAILTVILTLNDPPFSWTIDQIANWLEDIGQ